MAQTSGIHESAPPNLEAQQHLSTLRKVGSKIKLVVTRSIFWSYERGSWQYDVICVVILAFIFLSPRSWFNDRPTLQLTDLRHQQGVVEMRRVKREVQYLVDARLVESLNLKPEDAIPLLLKEHLQKAFTVKSIDAVRDRHQVVLGYTVMVEE